MSVNILLFEAAGELQLRNRECLSCGSALMTLRINTNKLGCSQWVSSRCRNAWAHSANRSRPSTGGWKIRRNIQCGSLGIGMTCVLAKASLARRSDGPSWQDERPSLRQSQYVGGDAEQVHRAGTTWRHEPYIESCYRIVPFFLPPDGIHPNQPLSAGPTLLRCKKMLVFTKYCFCKIPHTSTSS